MSDILKDEKRIKLLIFNTGGTLVCEELEGKLKPVNNLSKWIDENLYFKKEVLKLKDLELEFLSLKEILDSANASVQLGILLQKNFLN